MKLSTLGCAMLLAMSTMSATAFAQDEAEDDYKPFAATLTATTDYVWRGASQTDGGPAFQVDFNYTAPFGMYVGAFASNVDFGEDDPAEWESDFYIGYNVDLGEHVNFDVMLNRYTYGAASDQNWNDLITKTTVFDHYSLTLAYSNDSWATGKDGYYAALGGDWELPAGFTLGVSYGRSFFSTPADIEDYSDYSVSVGHDFGPLNLSVGWYGTDKAGKRVNGDSADNRVAVTATVNL